MNDHTMGRPTRQWFARPASAVALVLGLVGMLIGPPLLNRRPNGTDRERPPHPLPDPSPTPAFQDGQLTVDNVQLSAAKSANGDVPSKVSVSLTVQDTAPVDHLTGLYFQLVDANGFPLTAEVSWIATPDLKPECTISGDKQTFECLPLNGNTPSFYWFWFSLAPDAPQQVVRVRVMTHNMEAAPWTSAPYTCTPDQCVQ